MNDLILPQVSAESYGQLIFQPVAGLCLLASQYNLLEFSIIIFATPKQSKAVFSKLCTIHSQLIFKWYNYWHLNLSFKVSFCHADD